MSSHYPTPLTHPHETRQTFTICDCSQHLQTDSTPRMHLLLSLSLSDNLNMPMSKKMKIPMLVLA